MTRFSFIHAADIHLDSPLLGLSVYEGAPLELLRDAPRQAFRNLIDEAIREQVDFMVISGDLYDGGWKDFNTGLFFAKEMGRLNRENIPVFIVHGNHDAESELTKQLTLPANVKVFSARKPETHSLENLEVALHGQSFRDAKTENNLALNYPSPVSGYFNIGVLHTSVEGHIAHASYAPCALSDLTGKAYDYWALGHVHEYKVLSQAPLVVFPGNIQGRHIREPGARGALLVRVDNGNASTERIFVDTVRWYKVSVDAASAKSLKDVILLARGQLEALLREEDDGRLLAVRVIISGKSAVHGELFGLESQLRQEILAAANALSNDKLWIEKVINTTAPELEHATVALRSDAIADLQKILNDIGDDSDIQQRIVGELMELVGMAPLDLIDACPELLEIQKGEIKNQLDAISQGLVARMSCGEAAE